MTGFGFIKIRNAASVEITGTGKLKARGDFVQPNGFIVQGSLISIESAGSLSVSGLIDVTGDPAGTVLLETSGDLTLQNGSLIQANGTTSFYTDAQRYSDGGEVLLSAGLVITSNGDISATGTQHGAGGSVLLEAARTIVVARQIDASGGESDGGAIGISAGDHITITAPLSADSRGGGGFGGTIFLESGADALGGLVVGGNLTVDGVALQLNGSSAGGFGGDGGDLEAISHGFISFHGSGVAIRANAGTQYDGSGGIVVLDAGDSAPHALGPLDGDIILNGTVAAHSGNQGGDGGIIALAAGKNLTLNAPVDVTGKDSGGDVEAEAGGSLTLNGGISAQASSTTGDPGFVHLRAGLAQDATLTIVADVLAFGGSNNARGQEIRLSACSLVVGTGVKIDGHSGSSAGVLGGSLLSLVSRRPMQLNSSSQYLANPGGQIQTIHPPGQAPVIGSGVTFNPTRTDVTHANGPYEACPTSTATPTRTATPTSTRSATPTSTRTPTPTPTP